MLAEMPTWPAMETSLAVGEIGTMLMCEYEGASVGKPSGLKFRVAEDIARVEVCWMWCDLRIGRKLFPLCLDNLKVTETLLLEPWLNMASSLCI